MPGPSRPLRPVSVPVARVVGVGIALWTVALVLTLLAPALREGPRGYWPWTCATGLVLGAIGYAYIRRGRGNAAEATPDSD